MKTRKTKLLILLMGFLLGFPMEQTYANTEADFTGKVKRIKIKKRRVGFGSYKITVQGKISETTEGVTIKAELTALGDSPKPLTSSFIFNITSVDEKGNFTAERDFNCEKDDCLFGEKAAVIEDKYSMTAQMINSKKEPISKSVTHEVAVEEEEFQVHAKVTKLRLRRQGRKGRPYYHIVAGKISEQAEGAVIKVNIAPSSKESPKPLLDSFTLKITSIDENGNFKAEKVFSCEQKECLFGDDEPAENDLYKITTVVYNSKGEALSESKTQEVKIEVDDSECKIKYDLHHMSLSGLDFYAPYSEENTGDYPLFKKKKGSKKQTLTVPVTFYTYTTEYQYGKITISTGSNGNTDNLEIHLSAFYDKDKKAFTANWDLVDSVFIKKITITTSICGEKFKVKEINFNRIESVQGDEIHFKLRKFKAEKCNEKDSNCTAPIKLGNGITLKSSLEGSFQVLALDGVKFTREDNVLKELEVEAIIQMKDCKGTTINVAITLKYNEKTGTYMNSKALSLCNKTGMEVLSVNINAKEKEDNGWRGQFINVDVDISLSST